MVLRGGYASLDFFILFSAVGTFTSSLVFGFLMWLSNRRRELALKGDEVAALKIILPCYQPLYIFLSAVYLFMSVVLSLTFVLPLRIMSQFLILQYYSLTTLALFSIAPILLTQTSVSYMAFKRTGLIIGPWFVLCSLMWGLSDLSSATIPLQIVFWIVSCIPSLLFSIGILFKFVPSRIQMGSTSNRASVEYMLVYACFFVGINIATVPQLAAENNRGIWNLASLLSIFGVLWNQLFPLALHRTLLADTKFWRGLGRHNVGGLSYSDGNRTGVAVHKPTVGLAVVTDGLQRMMTEIEDITIDFAYLQLESCIGEGASSRVYRGQLKQKTVAVKVFVPPEITLEVIDEFMKESKLLSALRHDNIVQFMGICIRPPQIAMVMELCVMGNLKTSLMKYPAEWRREWRVRAAYDAARAVEYLHGLGYIHRDLKAENFFIGEGRVIKLGDFGEATKQRKHRPSTHHEAGGRMSIVGTVAYMAPELVAATKKYSESIDIYSLGITFWEIWTGLDPYEGMNTFQIYDHVSSGKRLEMPEATPVKLRELVEEAWSHDSHDRPIAGAIAERLKSILWDDFNYRVPGPGEIPGGLSTKDEDDYGDDTPGSRLSRMLFNNFGGRISKDFLFSKKVRRPSGEGRLSTEERASGGGGGGRLTPTSADPTTAKDKSSDFIPEEVKEEEEKLECGEGAVIRNPMTSSTMSENNV